MRLMIKMLMAVTTAILATSANAEPVNKHWENLQESYFSGKRIAPGPFIHLTAPPRAESGAQVPFAFSVDYPMTAEKYVKSVTLLVDENPVPLTAIFHFNPKSGKAEISTRIRLESDSFVHAVAETSDGMFYMNAIAIRASGGCGGTVGGDEALARKNAGKMKLAANGPLKASTPAKAHLLIKHPMYTGMQRDLASQGFKPAFFVKHIEARFNDENLMQADTFIGISEDPNIQFDFIPEKNGKLSVTIEDNEGGKFHHDIDVVVQQ